MNLNEYRLYDISSLSNTIYSTKPILFSQPCLVRLPFYRPRFSTGHFSAWQVISLLIVLMFRVSFFLKWLLQPIFALLLNAEIQNSRIWHPVSQNFWFGKAIPFTSMWKYLQPDISFKAWGNYRCVGVAWPLSLPNLKRKTRYTRCAVLFFSPSDLQLFSSFHIKFYPSHLSMFFSI